MDKADKVSIPFFQRLVSQIRFTIPIERVRTPFGEPFNENNHWVKTIYEYQSGIKNYKQSSLYAFHKNFRPKSVLDLIDDQILEKDIDIPLGSYPWGNWTSRRGEDWLLSTHCGPTEDNLVEQEWISFIALYESIKSEGVNFKKYGYPQGLFLLNQDRENFFIVLGGNHRLAVAYVLGLKSVKFRLIARDYITKQFITYSNIKDNPISKAIFENIISENFIEWR